MAIGYRHGTLIADSFKDAPTDSRTLTADRSKDVSPDNLIHMTIPVKDRRKGKGKK